MANIRGQQQGNVGGKPRSLDLAYQEFVPSSAWTEDANAHYLLVDLPDFKKEEVKLQIDNNDHIIISGERQVKLNKYSYFEQALKVPDNSDIQKITGKFDCEILYVTVPKNPIEVKEQHRNENVHAHNDEEHVDDKVDDDNESKRNGNESQIEQNEKMKKNEIIGSTRKWEKQSNMVKIAMEKLHENKGLVMTAVIAFSLGLLITHKLEYCRWTQSVINNDDGLGR